jgi:hypothetical protein
VFDPGSPVGRFPDEWEKSFNRLNMLKQFHPDKKLLYAHLQPVGSQLVSLEEVKFLPPAVVSPVIYHYFSTKWTDFHVSMQRGVRVNHRHDAALFQHDFFSEINSCLEELGDLEFLYAQGPQFEEYTLKEQKKFDEEEKIWVHFCVYFLQSPSRDGGDASVAESGAETFPQMNID